jgi:hypothetical protein
MFVRDILAKEAVKIASVEEQSQVVESVFWAVATCVNGVPCPCSSWTKPGGATVRDLRIQIGVKKSILS